MRTVGKLLSACVLGLMAAGAASGQSTPAAAVQAFQVRLAPGMTATSGRLIVIARPVGDFTPPGQALTEEQLQGRVGGGLSPQSDPNASAEIIARPDVKLGPGQTVELDAKDRHYPNQVRLAPGRYLVQAILDTNLDYTYAQRAGAGDLVSPVTVIDLPAQAPVLDLGRVVPARVSLWDQPAAAQSPTDSARLAAKANAERIYFHSKSLSAFAGRPVDIRAYVLTPPGYAQGREHFPTVFWTGGFGVTFDNSFANVMRTYGEMASGAQPPMIWVFLDHAGPTGTNEFADSANNGPWGQALTEEFIPWLEGKYRTDGKASGRFVTGHSSGGWTALWLQTRYPKVFGGAWPTAPDPSDFHDFTNIDIYAPAANAYRRPDGAPTLLVRATRTRPGMTFQSFAELEAVTGPVGGQIASFDWVFSPRGKDGKPQPLFDPVTGAVDPKVALYWRDNYDIAFRLRRDWKTLGPDLDGKIHLWVGTADTFHLDGPARLLKATLDELGAKSEFHFVEGADHGTLTALGGSRPGVLERRIAWEIYAQARPGSPLKPPAGATR